jgi:tetratricopeptide (TPR) repeat protein
MLLGHPLAPGLSFALPANDTLGYKEAQPWLDLLSTGRFSRQTLSKLPLSYQTTDRWLALVEQSVATQGLTWLHALHLGIAYAERGFLQEPKSYFEKSFAMKPNPLAARCLAVMQSTIEEAWPYYQQAWTVLHRDFQHDTDAYARVTRNLITEISFFLQQNLWYDEMATFAQSVIQGGYMTDYEVDAFLTMYTKVLIHNGEYTKARDILGSHCFPTYAKARDDLMNMWNTVSVGLAQQAKGLVPLTNVEKHQARVDNRIPDNIGCQYASEVSHRCSCRIALFV